jgi:OmpA family protein
MSARYVFGAVLICVGGAGQAGAEVFVYPKQGQSQEQFQKDQFECHNWAKQQTGFDPSQPSVAASPSAAPHSGGAVRGGARGAALGAIGGAIGGDAGKGAAVGAGVGAAAGGLRQRSANEQAAAASQQAMAQQQSNVQRYEQAYGACMGGRNYQVK